MRSRTLERQSRSLAEDAAMIVIAGAGLIGLATAFELAGRGATVRVIDAGEPAAAASWAGAGMLAPYTETLGSDAFETLCVESLHRYPDFVDAVRNASGVDPFLRLDGIVDAAFDDASVARGKARVATIVAKGARAAWLEREEALMLEPALGARVRGAVHSLDEGHVDNRRLGRALRAACEARGVTIDARAGAIALESDARRALGVRGPFGFVPADAVVNATGASAAVLAGVPDYASVPVTAVKGQMLALAMPRGFVRRVVWVPPNATVAHPYLVPRDDGRLLVGATVEPGVSDTLVTARAVEGLLAVALAAMPGLGDFAVAETWAGVRPGSPDGLPFLGETALRGYFTATGHYRNGILLTPATAVAIADALEGRASAALAPFSPQRVQEAAVGAAKRSAL